MKRAALIVVLVLAGIGGAATASRSVPDSTLGYQSVRVTGATMTDISYTVALNKISAITVKLRGNLALKAMSAAFNGTAGTCLAGVYDLTSNSTSFACTGFTQSANRSWSLQVTVS